MMISNSALKLNSKPGVNAHGTGVALNGTGDGLMRCCIVSACIGADEIAHDFKLKNETKGLKQRVQIRATRVHRLLKLLFYSRTVNRDLRTITLYSMQ